MSSGQYNYYDPEYDSERTAGNELLILISDELFSFAILRTDTKKVLVWGENYSHFELADPKDLKHILSANYDEVKVAVQSTTFTLIPKDLYNQNDLANYSKFLMIEPTDYIFVNELDASNYIVFSVKEGLIKILKRYIDLKNVFFAAKPLIMAINFVKPLSQNLYAHLEENLLHLVYFRNDQLGFYNVFEFNNADELMYYVLLVSNELNLNLEETSVILSGKVTFADQKIHRVNDMLANVYFNQNQIVTLPQGFLSHQILMLAGLTLCGSLVED